MIPIEWEETTDSFGSRNIATNWNRHRIVLLELNPNFWTLSIEVTSSSYEGMRDQLNDNGVVGRFTSTFHRPDLDRLKANAAATTVGRLRRAAAWMDRAMHDGRRSCSTDGKRWKRNTQAPVGHDFKLSYLGRDVTLWRVEGVPWWRCSIGIYERPRDEHDLGRWAIFLDGNLGPPAAKLRAVPLLEDTLRAAPKYFEGTPEGEAL